MTVSDGSSRRGTAIGLAVGLVAAAAVIGTVTLRSGDEKQTFERASIEEEFTTQMRSRIADQGGTMDALECVKDEDDLHWRCLTNARIAGQGYALTVSITCDRETARCLSEPATIAPMG
jgi:hypothetical protein